MGTISSDSNQKKPVRYWILIHRGDKQPVTGCVLSQPVTVYMTKQKNHEYAIHLFPNRVGARGQSHELQNHLCLHLTACSLLPLPAAGDAPPSFPPSLPPQRSSSAIGGIQVTTLMNSFIRSLRGNGQNLFVFK